MSLKRNHMMRTTVYTGYKAADSYIEYGTNVTVMQAWPRVTFAVTLQGKTEPLYFDAPTDGQPIGDYPRMFEGFVDWPVLQVLTDPRITVTNVRTDVQYAQSNYHAMAPSLRGRHTFNRHATWVEAIRDRVKHPTRHIGFYPARDKAETEPDFEVWSLVITYEEKTSRAAGRKPIVSRMRLVQRPVRFDGAAVYKHGIRGRGVYDHTAQWQYVYEDAVAP